MGPSQSGAPAAWQQHQSTGTNSNRRGTAQHYATDTAGATATNPSPLDADAAGQGTLHHFHSSLPFPFQLNNGVRVPTPIRQDHDFSDSYMWYAQNQGSIASLPVQLPQEQPVFMPHMAAYGPVQGQQVYGNLQADPSRCLQARPGLIPSANLWHSSPGQRPYQEMPAYMSPPIQEWPTHNLVAPRARKKHEKQQQNSEVDRAKRPLSQQLTESSLPQQCRIPPALSADPWSCEKRKASIDDSQPPPTPAPPLRRVVPDPASDAAHCPSSHPAYQIQHPYNLPDSYFNLPQAQQQPFFFDPQPGVYHPVKTDYQQNELDSASADYSFSTNVQDSRNHSNQPPVCPLQHRSHRVQSPPPSQQHDYIFVKRLQPMETQLSVKPVCREDTHQPITPVYQDYKWPVKLYELRPDTKFDFAETYMDDWFAKNVYSSDKYKWHSHTTIGFIKGGNRFSMLVLHNAANPFQWGSAAETTTSVAVYGRYAHTHEEFRWITVTPWIVDFFKNCVDFTVKETWDFDMPKASDRRFHRAYWLAANMLPLGGLLNHCLTHEKPHDALEEGNMEDEFQIGEEDLQCRWSDGQPSAEYCEKVWQRILDEVEGRDMWTLGSDHIAIGGTERMYELD